MLMKNVSPCKTNCSTKPYLKEGDIDEQKVHPVKKIFAIVLFAHKIREPFILQMACTYVLGELLGQRVIIATNWLYKSTTIETHLGRNFLLSLLLSKCFRAVEAIQLPSPSFSQTSAKKLSRLS
jgi:hypothetical protein